VRQRNHGGDSTPKYPRRAFDTIVGKAIALSRFRSGKKFATAVGLLLAQPSFDRRKRKETLMSYVDGFVVAVPKQKMDAYKTMARKAGDVWKEHGALAFVECIGDDVPYGELTSFPRAVQAKDDETVVFSWIVYQSREQRDAVNAKVMADPRMKEDMTNMPFDGKRMIYGGFKPFLEL
jgi:uncharacterized protein YbaA (DUF1428 family)